MVHREISLQIIIMNAIKYYDFFLLNEVPEKIRKSDLNNDTFNANSGFSTINCFFTNLVSIFSSSPACLLV